MGTIICYGDSNTYGYNPASGGQYSNSGWVSILREKTGFRLVNLGMLGRCVPSGPSYAVWEIETVAGEHSDLWIMLGYNDLLEGRNATETCSQMKQFIKAVFEVLPPECVTLIAPPVMKPGTWISSEDELVESGKLQDVYKDLAAELRIIFISTSAWDIPLAFDGVHFTEEGHVRFAEKIFSMFR